MKNTAKFRRAGRLARVQVSEIVQIAEAARERRAAGENVIGLGTGEPNFDTCLLYTSPSPRDRG